MYLWTHSNVVKKLHEIIQLGKLFRGPDQYKISICRPVQKLVKYSSVIYFSYKLESYVSIVV